VSNALAGLNGRADTALPGGARRVNPKVPVAAFLSNTAERAGSYLAMTAYRSYPCGTASGGIVKLSARRNRRANSLREIWSVIRRMRRIVDPRPWAQLFERQIRIYQAHAVEIAIDQTVEEMRKSMRFGLPAIRA